MEFLHVEGNRIVNESGQSIHLHGTNIGAWMNMEDFMTSFPGVEHRLRYYAKEILGEEMGAYYFESLLDHFFTEEDVAYMASIGINCLRLPVNYRHFEDDMHPFQYKEEGFRRLDRALDWCEKYGIYVMLDLHAVQGWQNCDWHCDNFMRTSLLWRTAQYQDRAVALWEVFARRYKDRAVIAGYDLINEPTTNNQYTRMPLPYVADWEAMNALYHRLFSAIRAIDTRHIIVLEGDDFSRRFEGLDAPYDGNMVYSSHNYSFVKRFHPEITDPEEIRQAVRKEFYDSEGFAYCRKHNVPLWVSEFALNDDQLELFAEEGVHWTAWSFKTASPFALVSAKADSPYVQFVAPYTRNTFGFRGAGSPEAQKVMDAVKALQTAIQDAVQPQLPGFDPVQHDEYFPKTISDIYYAPLLQYIYLNLFRGVDKAQMDALMASFSFSHCQINPDVEALYKRYCQD